MLATMVARVLGKSRPNYADGNFAPVVNPRGDLSVAQGLLPASELARQGDTYSCSIATGSAFTHVAAWPTTRAEILIWNGESAGGKYYVLHSAWAANVATSIGAASAYTLLGQLVASGVAPTDDAAQLITSRSGRAVYGATYGGKAKRAVANTAYMVASRWEVLAAATTGGATATIGTAVYADLQGSWIIPPGGVMGFNLVAGTATGTASIGFTWSEVQLPQI